MTLPTKIAMYPGSFDPVTFGHIDIIKRASRTFGRLIVAIAKDSSKAPLFSVEERLKMLKKATAGLKNVEVESFNGLTANFARKNNCKIIIRSIRMISDFEYEFQLALMNRKLASDIETIFMMPSESYLYISSKLIKEVAALGSEINNFVPEFVAKEIKKRMK